MITASFASSTVICAAGTKSRLQFPAVLPARKQHKTATQFPDISSFSWHPLPFLPLSLSSFARPYAFWAEKAGIR